MADLIVILMVAAVVGAAVRYIVKQKKNGAVCIGCSMSGTCAKQKNGGCNCNSDK